ncbi:MAG: hypothetical protein K0Q73_1439 [Paenibacillus sp.]|nr:hypothetical protein [Paenibacillus sp.]
MLSRKPELHFYEKIKTEHLGFILPVMLRFFLLTAAINFSAFVAFMKGKHVKLLFRQRCIIWMMVLLMLQVSFIVWDIENDLYCRVNLLCKTCYCFHGIRLQMWIVQKALLSSEVSAFESRYCTIPVKR